ncbi:MULTISPECIES: hypothetical protein [unclassified Streptomyces]|uniref:hypothetical protein n=1 Tax=unclassified Streptomyces TaxID=2593676 RepID=UPI0004C30DFE
MALAERPSRAWEIADLVRDRLFVLPNPLAAWDSDPFWVSVWDSDPDRVRVSLNVPRESAAHYVQLIVSTQVTADPPGLQADRIVAALRAPHPLDGAVVCGGYPACAASYGYAWPPSLDEAPLDLPE